MKLEVRSRPIKALEDAGLLTWVHRLTRIRRREQDLFGHWGSAWQVIRTSNAYHLLDPLDRDPGRRGYQSENPARPQNRDLKTYGAPLAAAQVMQEATSQAPPVQTKTPAFALQREPAPVSGAAIGLTR